MISIFLPSDFNTYLEIFDIQGRLLKRLADGLLSSGSHDFVWNGINQNDDVVATGAYFCFLIAGQNVMTWRTLPLK